jgi:hypothetical protein
VIAESRPTNTRFTTLAALFVSAVDRAMFLLFLHGRHVLPPMKWSCLMYGFDH